MTNNLEIRKNLLSLHKQKQKKMRIVNIIETDEESNIVSIDSFVIKESDNEEEIMNEVKDLFIKKAMDNDMSFDEALNSYCEFGCASIDIGGWVISVRESNVIL